MLKSARHSPLFCTGPEPRKVETCDSAVCVTLEACVVLAPAHEPTVHQSLNMRHDFNSASLRPRRQSSRDSIVNNIHVPVQLAGEECLVEVMFQLLPVLVDCCICNHHDFL